MSASKIACVTGAAQGIGWAIALRLAADGCDISVGDISSKLPLLEELANEIKAKGRKAIAIAVDVSKEADVDNFVTLTVKQLGGLDIMVANAGVATLGNIIDTTVEELERVHAVNVKGTFVCYKAAAKTIISQGRGGVIIGASSLAEKKGAGMCSVYGSSKFAVRAITQAAAMEWGKHGIRVNGYAPGAADTPLLADIDVVFGNLIGAPPNTEIMKKQLAIAGAVSFLASKDAKSMTGKTLTVRGGRRNRSTASSTFVTPPALLYVSRVTLLLVPLVCPFGDFAVCLFALLIVLVPDVDAFLGSPAIYERFAHFAFATATFTSSTNPAPPLRFPRTLEGLGHTDADMELDEELSNGHEGDLDVDEVAEIEAEMNGEVARLRERRNGKRRATTQDEAPVAAPPTEEKKKIDWEIPRKVLHSSIGFITLALYLTPSMSPRLVALTLWAALAVIAPVDFIRLRSPAVERVYERWLGFLMRESEKTSTNGVLWYILGVNFALTFYPIDVATVAILILSWADTAASTVGRMYGPRTPPLPQSVSLAWLPWWVWVPSVFLAPAPSTPAPASKMNGHVNGYANGHAPTANGTIKENPKGRRGKERRLRTPFAPRKSTAGFAAACVTGAVVALAFWLGLANGGLLGGGGWGTGWVQVKGVAEMRAVAEGHHPLLDSLDSLTGGSGQQYHSQYSIAGQYLRSDAGAWARRWVPEGLIGGASVAPPVVSEAGEGASADHATTPARFGVGGVLGLVAIVICAGVVSGVAEALDLGGLDDNLTLPIISGGALMAFFRVWGWAVGAA
ncbi:hypothetical protein MSAN_02108600 [Mycena sanguinolenta]|uniref:Uncharacterized protein n=1 Tax=Mycena sanguinolenta TaxID=230812 RepID=A0A8H7CKD8_9AGAR|nr:hypothetical protein MSAN_02108600 [Mycena sanguinolenta]